MRNNKNLIIMFCGIALIVVWMLILFVSNQKTDSEKKSDIPDWVKTKISSEFDQKEQESIQQKIESLESKDLDNKSDIIDLAKNYRYLWYIWKALNIYDQKFPLSTDFVVLSNKANLQSEFCKLDSEKYENFCKEALKNYNFLIQNYDEKKYDRLSQYYIKVAKVLLNMNKKAEAQKVYNIYKSKTDNSVSSMEKIFNS